MQHEPQNTFDLRSFVERIVWAGIWAARNDPTEMKQRIMTARQCGFLSDDDCDFLIPVLGLTEA